MYVSSFSMIYQNTKTKMLSAGWRRAAVTFCLLAFTVAGAHPLQAQEGRPVSFGIIGGLPVNNWFNINNYSSLANYSSADKRYEVGPTAEFHFKRIRFEVDAIYKRLGYTDNFADTDVNGFLNGLTDNQNVKANQWEFPGLFKFNFAMGHFRPWVGVGASLRHISSIRDVYNYAGGSYPITSDNSPILAHRNSFGGVAALGMTFKKGPFELSPQARYTRWSNEAFESQLQILKTNLDQGDVLMSITF